MPQGRRKTPFSGKAKKEQLKAKKHGRSAVPHHVGLRRPHSVEQSDDDDIPRVLKVNRQPYIRGDAKRNPNRYVLQFHRESEAELRDRKEKAHQSIVPVSERELEILAGDYFLKELDFPKRPEWSFDTSREELESRENRYFTEYILNLEKRFDWSSLSYFELNLETWRQLWRVLEMSDVILFIVDIRFPALMFPPSLYEHVTKDLGKSMVLVLNKIDLAPAPLVVAWKHHFKTEYPELHVVTFTTLPGYNLRGSHTDKAGLNIRRRKGKLRMAAEGAQILFDVCQKIVQNEVDLSSWQKKIKDEMSFEYNDDEDDVGVEIGQTVNLRKVDTCYYEHEKYKNGVLTIGCIGQPNVGKSSLMNAIMGKKVVSVSKTPGHTKHFQTIFLTPNVRLCDCPGLVFPSKVPKTLQVLMGSFPIAQLREPYSAIRYLAERLDLPKMLRIQHPENDDQWSAVDLCDGWAMKRGYRTAKAARLDTYRAANSILRMALDGKICLCLRPPGYFEKQAEWEKHPDVETIKRIQANSDEEASASADHGDVSESSEDETQEQSSAASGDQRRDQLSSRESESSDDSDGEVSVATGSNKFALLSARGED